MTDSLTVIGVFGSYSQNSASNLDKHDVCSKSNSEQAQPRAEYHFKSNFHH